MRQTRTKTDGTVLISIIAILFPHGSAWAGSLEPPGSPAPTMRSLEQVTPSWDRILPANDGPAGGCNSSRFTCVLGGAAVRDNESGLVWERNPTVDYVSQQPVRQLVRWSAAASACESIVAGGRMGWRLPTMAELTSLVGDVTTITSGPAPAIPTPLRALPSGHPFQNISNQIFWVAGTLDSFVLSAGSGNTLVESVRGFIFGNPGLSAAGNIIGTSVAAGTGMFWCVRGPGGSAGNGSAHVK